MRSHFEASMSSRLAALNEDVNALLETARMDSENIIYWKGRPVGMDNGRFVSWFSSAPAEAMRQLKSKR